MSRWIIGKWANDDSCFFFNCLCYVYNLHEFINKQIFLFVNQPNQLECSIMHYYTVKRYLMSVTPVQIFEIRPSKLNTLLFQQIKKG